MADIFISYKSEDRERARQVAGALQAEGFDVWWDPALQAGEDYQEVIDTNLRQSLVVVVLWSPRSVKSRWVRSEATIGDRYGALAPCMIEACDLPTAFVLVQTVDLSHWRGAGDDPKWREFADEVRAKRDKRRALRASDSPAAATPDANQIESLFWQTIKDSAEPADFRSYMKRYPQGHFHDLAETRLTILTASNESSAVPAASQAKKRGLTFAHLLAWIGVGVVIYAALAIGSKFIGSPEVDQAESIAPVVAQSAPTVTAPQAAPAPPSPADTAKARADAAARDKLAAFNAEMEAYNFSKLDIYAVLSPTVKKWGDYIETAAKAGNARAAVLQGYRDMSQGQVEPVRRAKGLRYLKQACAAGEMNGCYYAGEFYQSGFDSAEVNPPTIRNFDAARVYFKMACDGGLAVGCSQYKSMDAFEAYQRKFEANKTPQQ